MHNIYTKGNMGIISPNITINISCIHGKIENVYIGTYFSPQEIRIYNELFKKICDVFIWSYEEMPGIHPHIVKNEIKAYQDAKPIWQ
jgi:hypothetical protein